MADENLSFKDSKRPESGLRRNLITMRLRLRRQNIPCVSRPTPYYRLPGSNYIFQPSIMYRQTQWQARRDHQCFRFQRCAIANTLGCNGLFLQNCSLLLRTYVGKFKALLSLVLFNIGSVMTFGPDLLKPPSHLLLQHDTWEVVSRGVLQNVYSRLPWTKPFQAEFWASEFDREI